MLNKKIASELAVGVILILALIMGGIFWLQEKKTVISNELSIIDDKNVQENLEEEKIERAKVAEQEDEISITTKGKKNYVILKRNGEEIIIDQGDSEYDKEYKNISDVKFFSDAMFSPLKNYVIYNMKGWEWSIHYVYDIEKRKIVLEQSSAITFEFTPDEKYFIDCAASDFDGTFDGKIFRIGNFESPVFDVLKNPNISRIDYSGLYCQIKDDNVSFILNNDDRESEGKEPANKTVIYSLSQNKVIK